MNTKELDARVRSLDDRLRAIEDMEGIENLLRIYGQYLDYSMWDKVVDLFSDNTESIEIGAAGIFLGKAGVERMFRLIAENREEFSPQGDLHGMVVPRKFFHMIMIGQPVIDIDPGGKAAYGRWQALECATRYIGGTWTQYWGGGIYESEYIKEDGRWKFKKLHFYLIFKTPYHESGLPKTQINYYHSSPDSTLHPDRPTTFDHRYPDPECCTVPFHYRHPITGQ